MLTMEMTSFHLYFPMMCNSIYKFVLLITKDILLRQHFWQLKLEISLHICALEYHSLNFFSEFWFCNAAFAKLYSSTSANNSILTGVQYNLIQKILPQHRPLITNLGNSWCAGVVSQTLALLGQKIYITNHPFLFAFNLTNVCIISCWHYLVLYFEKSGIIVL